MSGIPSDTYASFLTYAFPPSSPLRGLQIGGGIRFIGSSFADDQNTVRNTAVTLYDALVAYDFAALDPKYKGFRAQINAYNIFDRNYTTCSFGFCKLQPACESYWQPDLSVVRGLALWWLGSRALRRHTSTTAATRRMAAAAETTRAWEGAIHEINLTPTYHDTLRLAQLRKQAKRLDLKLSRSRWHQTYI